eukprot:CAMPEP_0113846368 /NCGR_PEP_ID=MMETSP0372-20130328/1269_2 /TAXON_ID=340204 /ORGANISM="Lankesteria abbotti" /LENGTH=58 /DNA_ID=CAMNT_0000815505 /DNA_START=682 /DNA_END=854 /DNA_ORIENTATION=- /assembly_acc=CAM_ASM_000359
MDHASTQRRFLAWNTYPTGHSALPPPDGQPSPGIPQPSGTAASMDILQKSPKPSASTV